VTYVTPFPKNYARENLTYIDISSIVEDNANLYKPDLHTLPLKTVSLRQTLQLGVKSSQHVLQHQAMQELMLHQEASIDVVIAHWYHNTLLSPLSVVFDCPLIWYVAHDACWGAQRLVHEATSPAYSTGVHSARTPSIPFTIKERALQIWQQFYSGFLSRYYAHYVELPLYGSLYSAAIPERGRMLPPYELVTTNGSLLLINSHPPLGQSLPLPLNAKLVGGHHLKPDTTLSNKLQSFMDNVKDGVIYMDLGANVNSEDIPSHVRSRLLEMFGQLKQQVLWRLDMQPPHRPSNVHLFRHAPALPILCHPNTVSFITDGSSTSLMDAIQCGVPVVTVPLLGDQFVNADLAVARGFAKRVEFTHHFAWKLRDAIEEILRNTSYRSSAFEASKIFKLRPQPAPAELLHWVEYIISTGGRHLRSPAVHLSAIERYHLDIWLLLAMILWFLSKVIKVIKVHLKDDYDKKND
ncbi:unnamed protein product, partial [Diatraea saccharalis]